VYRPIVTGAGDESGKDESQVGVQKARRSCRIGDPVDCSASALVFGWIAGFKGELAWPAFDEFE
jgi:hypothetical protein